MLKRAIPSLLQPRVGFAVPVINSQKTAFSFSSSSIRERIKRERSERAKASEQYFPTKSFDNLSFIRNFGIIAHIDAGKTTTTERMLYYAGALAAPGEVHEGTTVMDYMDQERDRGITIRAAAITFTWEKHQFNLIDTPGHIDFNAEVERSLRVLDGAIAIFDAVHGVQTQSEIVWMQANKFKIPRLAFVNKMDRSGASLETCVESIKQRLNIQPFVIQLPIGSAETFSGIIDLVTLKKITWEDEMGEDVVAEDLAETDPLYAKAIKEREQLIDSISLFDDSIAEDFLEGKEIEADRLDAALRTILREHPAETCAVYVGSSLKNKGIQPLMDGVVKYLPSPNEREAVMGTDVLTGKEFPRFPKKDEKLCALAFKVINDAQKGPLVYVRIYSGTFGSKSPIYNVTQNAFEKSAQIFRVRADEYVGVQNLHAGDIAAISGLKATYSGDTLIDGKDDVKLALQGVEVPPPVFIASVEYESLKDKQGFDQACAILTREDPSLRVEENEETGQILVSGLGELHLEIFRDRLQTEYKLNTKLGTMKVAYRESVTGHFQQSAKISKPIYGKPSYADLEMSIERAEPEDLLFVDENPETSYRIVNGTNVLMFDVDQGSDFMRLYNEYKRRIIKKKLGKQGGEKSDNPELAKVETSDLAHIRNLRNPNDAEPLVNQSLYFPISYLPIQEEIEDEYGYDSIYPINCAPFEMFYAIETAVWNALESGVLLGAPVLNTKVTLTGGSYSENRSTDTIFQMCSASLLKELFQGATPVLLEPVMDLEVSTPSTEVKHVMNDIISTRRGKVIEMKEEKSNFGGQGLQRTMIQAVVPLQETVGYSTYLRSITKGEAHFLMRFKQYDEVGQLKQKEILSTYF